MKTKKTFLKNILLFSIGVCLSLALGCSGEDGETGAQGPAGKDGVDGQDGNANVIASEWMQIVWSYTNGEDYAYMNILVEEIMEFVEKGGIVMLYLRNDLNGTTVSALPVTYSSGISYDFSYGEFPNNIEGIRLFVDHPNYDLLENNPNLRVRYVLVPANMAQANGMVGKIPKSYEEAVSLLGLD